MSGTSKSLLIVSGESSGELYGALLAEEVRRTHPEVKIFGVGGERMKGAGVGVFREVSHAFGLMDAARALRGLKETYKETLKRVEEMRPPVAVLIDFPDFNFKLARELKKRGVKILYYVSPQVWAWRAGRIKKMKEFVDRAALILPFEEELYRKAGIPCEFVGHPILDEIRAMPEARKSDLGLPETPVISILPGSRPSEFRLHLPVLIETLPLLIREFPEHKCFLPVAPNLDIRPFNGPLSKLRELGAVVKKESALKALALSDAALIASGTATLQAAFLGTPFCLFYKLPPISFFIGRLIIHVKYVGLSNILIGRAASKELLQKDVNPAKLMAEMRRLLNDQPHRDRLKADFARMRGLFEGRSASQRVALMASDMAGWS
jgi:lipid-A-disaccharide synthase